MDQFRQSVGNFIENNQTAIAVTASAILLFSVLKQKNQKAKEFTQNDENAEEKKGGENNQELYETPTLQHQFDFQDRNDVLNLVQKVRKVYFVLHCFIASNSQLLTQSYGNQIKQEEIEQFIRQSSKIAEIRNIQNQTVLQQFQIEQFDLQEIKNNFLNDKDIVKVINDIEEEFGNAIKGQEPTADCDTPSFLTKDLIQQILNKFTRLIAYELRNLLLSQKGQPNPQNPQALLQQKLEEIEYGDFKDKILEEFQLEDPNQDVSGRQILESTLLQLAQDQDMKQFLRESHVKQMMLIQMIIVDPENEKELDIFLSQSLPKEQVDMMMLSFGMV